MSYVKPEQLKMLNNPMLAGLIHQFAGDSDALGKFLKLVELVQTDPVGTHEQLEIIHQKIGEALDADHREQPGSLACIASPESWPGGPIWDDWQREDNPQRHTEGSVVKPLQPGQSADSGQQTALPGAVGVDREISETPLHQVGAKPA